MEVCGSAHLSDHRIAPLEHDIQLMPPAAVKHCVKRQNKVSAAICDAVTRPSMRVVKNRPVGNQSVQMHHKGVHVMHAPAPQTRNCLSSAAAEIRAIAAQSPVRDRARGSH